MGYVEFGDRGNSQGRGKRLTFCLATWCPCALHGGAVCWNRAAKDPSRTLIVPGKVLPQAPGMGSAFHHDCAIWAV